MVISTIQFIGIGFKSRCCYNERIMGCEDDLNGLVVDLCYFPLIYQKLDASKEVIMLK